MSRWLFGQPVHTGGWRRGYALMRFYAGAEYEVGAQGSGWRIKIPSDFVFDNSAPWWVAWALPKRPMRRACGLHDFSRQDPAWSLWFGNLLFLDAMQSDNVKEPWLTLCWEAVRLNRRRLAAG